MNDVPDNPIITQMERYGYTLDELREQERLCREQIELEKEDRWDERYCND
jgi:hypothetical protein